MDPLADPETQAALGAARRLLHDASSDAVALRHRVDALADATDWRARATQEYRAGVARLADELARLVRLIGVTDDQAADAQHGAAALGLRRWS
jgi:hypothetical protein